MSVLQQKFTAFRWDLFKLMISCECYTISKSWELQIKLKLQIKTNQFDDS